MDDYGDKLNTVAAEHLKRIRSATQKMGLLIDDLLKLSEVTRSPMQREPVDLSGMAQSIAAELTKRDGQRRVEWIIEQNVQVTGDSRLLQVVLDNLLGNAGKYTSRHSNARIEFGLKRQNGSVAYFVKDDGAGFDPEYSSRLFGCVSTVAWRRRISRNRNWAGHRAAYRPASWREGVGRRRDRKGRDVLLHGLGLRNSDRRFHTINVEKENGRSHPLSAIPWRVFPARPLRLRVSIRSLCLPLRTKRTNKANLQSRGAS